MKDIFSNIILPFIFIFVISFLIIYILTPHGSATTFDSLNYLDISTNFKNGNGLVGTDFSLENYSKQKFLAIKAWPPLYSVFLSASTLQTPSAATASRLSIVLLSVTILFVYLILSAYYKEYIALLSSLALCLTVPIISIYTYAWSETLFIPLLTIATWSSIQYLKSDNHGDSRKHIYFSLLLVAIIGLAYTRYIGIIYFLLLPVTYLISKRKKGDLKWLAAASAAYGLFVGYLLYSNYLATDSISGLHRKLSQKTAFENIGDLYAAASVMLPNSFILLGALVIISVLITTFAKKFVIRKDDNINSDNTKSLLVLAFVFLLYVIALVILRTTTHFDDLDVRLLAPVFPILWIMLFVLLSIFNNKERLNFIICTPVIFFAISFILAGYTQMLVSAGNWKRFGTPMILANNKGFYANFTLTDQHNMVKQFLASQVDANSVLIAERPIIARFLTGIPSVGFPAGTDLKKIRESNNIPAERPVMVSTTEKEIKDYHRNLKNEDALVLKFLNKQDNPEKKETANVSE